MTRTEIIHRHAQRVLNGWPMPTRQHLEHEMRCGVHYAAEAIERIQNIVFGRLIGRISVPNPEPGPEWMR